MENDQNNYLPRSGKIEINKDKLVRMFNRILKLEQSNAKTAKFTRNNMIREIQKIIEEEESKCY